MNKKSIIISSSGLRNIIPSRFTKEEDLIMIFGQQKIQMNSIFAEFISPLVSHLRISDPTIQLIDFNNFVPDKQSNFKEFAKDIFTEDMISLLCKISSGLPVELDKYQALKMRFISIVLNNEELFSKINEVYPPDFINDNIDMYLKYVESCYHFSQFSHDFDFSELIKYLSQNFYAIDQEEFLKLPRRMQLEIISNPNLQIKNEDSLLDLIIHIISKKEDETTVDDISFLEQIEFTSLTEEKLRFFLSEFDFNQISNSLWKKLYQCFFIHFDKIPDRTIKPQHSIKQYSFDYNQNSSNKFKGIIDHLSSQFNGNVNETGVCAITASSIFEDQDPSVVANLEDDDCFSTLIQRNSWIKYDFKERKVRPNFYSIRTWGAPRNNSHLKNWVIEGSNDDKEWKVLDSRRDINCLNNRCAEAVFEIQTELDQNEFFRFLRLKQTGLNAKNQHNLMLSALEFFGSMILN